MIDLKRLEKEVRILDLNSYEARIWLALLSKGVASAGELSELANVPRSRTYDILKSLERKGFVVQKVEKPIKYEALAPEIALENYKEYIKRESENKVKVVDRLKESDVFKEIENLYNKNTSLGSEKTISYIKGLNNILNFIHMLANKANEEIYIFTTPEEFERTVYQFRKLLKKRKDEGVQVNIVVNGKVEELQLYQNILEGANIITVPTKEVVRGVIKDSEEVILFLNRFNETHPTQEVAVHMESPFVASFMKKLLIREE